MSDEDFSVDGSSSLVAAAAAASDRDKRAPRFSWTPAYENTFFRSLCESVQLGLRENHSFKAEAWDRAAIALQQKHGALPAKSHLVNKSDNARKKFRLWRGLREDPEFLYNPNSRTVTATEEAWKSHIEREPLSRALRGRPFEHEDYMEILYPDVIGSGGAPKRIMKPKRKPDEGFDSAQGSEDPDLTIVSMPDSQIDAPFQPSEPQPYPQPGLPPQPAHPMLAQSQLAGAQQPMPPGQQRPTSTAIPPRSHIGGSSALTPPEETATQGRRRFPGTHGSQQASPAGEAHKAPAAPMGPPPTHVPGHHPEKRRRVSGFPPSSSGAVAANSSSGSSASSISSRNNNNNSSSNGNSSNSSTSAPAPPDAPAGTVAQLIDHGLSRVEEALRLRAPPRWPEQAMDIFFRDFSSEDMDLQLKIAEKALADENKAMVFCKMPPALRKHWVKRLREVHNNRVT